MKKNLLLLLGVLLVCMNSWAAYELVWCDEFNANELNRTAWTVQTGGGGWGNNELQYYTDRTSNIYVGGGNLHIIARKEDYGGRNYTSGRMEGNGHMQARYGRVEARIKCPPACMGSWPAFWMLGKRPNGACDWPSSGEIDIMEQMCNGDPATWNTTLCTLHWNTSGKESYYDWGNQWNHGMYGLSRNVGEQLGNRYRIYGVEWTPTKIIGYYSDGDAGNCGPGNRVEYYVADIGNAANGLDAFSEYEFFILLNYAVGGTYVGGNVEPNFGTREMLVDWVRIYQDRAAYPGSTLNNQTNLTPANQGMNGNNGGGNNTINYAIDGENITTLTAGKSTTFNVKYSAPSESDIWLTLYHVTGDNWDLIAEKKKVNSVAAGENKTTTITLDIPSSVEGRNDYTLFFDIRPVGTDWQQRKANEQINNVTVKSIPKGVSGKSGKYKIKRTDCDQYWDMNGNGTANGTALCQYNDEGTELYQQFHLEEVSANSGIYRIYANDTGKLIDINAASQDNGAKVQIWENTNCECQQFILVDAGNGAYNFIALHSLKAIEVPSCSMDANTNMQQWDNNGQSCAKWQLIPYSQVTANQNNNNTSSSNEKYCGKRVVGYFPTYRYGTVNSVDFSAMTHCLLSFALYANGNVYFQDFSADQIRNVVNKCHAGNTKILLAIGGWNGFQNDGAFSTAAKRTAFVNQVMNYVNTYGFDGVDLDIELNDADIWNNIDALLSELKSALNGKLVTMALSTWFSNGIPNSAYQKLDFINLMSYDYNQNGTGDHAPWQQIYDMVGYYRARGVSDDKMTIGVPFYGYSTSGAKTFGEIVGWDAANANKDFANGTYYNGIPTIKAKAKYSKDFGGVMFWEAGQDAFNSYSLLKAIKEEMSDCSGGGNPGGNDPVVTETVAFDAKPTSLDSKTSYSFKINYTAAQQREVWITMYDNSGNWQVLTNGEAHNTVNAGSGSTTVTVNLATAPNAGNGYVIKADIRPVGGSWDTYIKEDLAQNITIKSTESAGSELAYNSSCNLLRNASIDFSHSFFATGDNWVENPSVKPTGNSFQKITYNMPEATSAQWQAQVVATSNVILKAGTKYEMSVKLKSTVNMSNVTLKCYQFGVNDVYFPSDNSGQGISLTANTTKTIALKDLTVSNDLNPLSVLFDFGGNPAGSVEISDIVIKEVACTPTYLKADHPVATFYADINYAGTAIGLEEGSYKSSDLEDYGIKLKDITSIKALPGFKVTIYTADNFGGNSKAFTGDVNYVGADWNDKMMSVKIEASGVSGVSGVRIINNRKSSKNLDVAGFSTVSGTQLIQYNVTNTDNQRFEFKEISNGVYRLQVKNAGGKYLGIRSGSYDNGAALETQNLNNNAKSQQFILVEAGDGFYKLVARHSGKIVEISNASMDNDALAQQWTDNGQVCGQWTINYYCGTTVSIAPTSKVLTCTESSVVLTASANETATYKWSNNSTANTNKVTNSGAYTVTVTNGVGCTATASVSVSANKTVPTITIGGAQDITCKTASMVLTASGADSYTWASGEKVATKEVTAAGTYSVVGRNANGCEATKAVTISENKETVAVTIGGNEVLTCANPSITLQANAALADSYRWNDNSTGATKVVTNAGQRNVTVTYGTCTASASVSVSANKTAPIVAIAGNEDLTCTKTQIILTASGADSYTWTSGEKVATKEVTAAGTYSVVGRNANGCEASASVSVANIKDLDDVTISGDKVITCQNDVVTLTATAAGASFTWSTGENTANISVSESKVYSVTATKGACTSTASVAVSDSRTNIIVSVSTNNSNIKVGSSFTLTASANSGNDFTWYKNNAKVGTGSTFTIAHAQKSDAAEYKAIVKDGSCVGEASITIAVNNADAPTINTQPASQTATVGDNVTFSIATEAGCTYQWYKNGVQVGTGNTYTINGVSKADNGAQIYCDVTKNGTTAKSNTATLTVKYAAPTGVTINGATSAKVGDAAIVLTAVANGEGLSYKWSTGSSASTEIITTTEAKTLIINVTVSNEGGSSIASHSIIISAKEIEEPTDDYSDLQKALIVSSNNDNPYVNTEVEYNIDNASDNVTYTWDVIGGTIISETSGNSVVVRWDEIGEQKLTIIPSRNGHFGKPQSSTITVKEEEKEEPTEDPTDKPTEGDDENEDTNVAIDNNSVSISVYPNPTTDFVYVQSNKAMDIVNISLYDLQGRLINQYMTYENGLYLGDKCSGIYILKIQTTDQSFTEQIIIK